MIVTDEIESMNEIVSSEKCEAKCEVFIENQPCYPGQLVHGRVECTFPSEKKIRGALRHAPFFYTVIYLYLCRITSYIRRPSTCSSWQERTYC